MIERGLRAGEGCPVARGRVYTPAQAALILGVSPKTVGRRVRPVVRTLGGHRRYAAADVWRAACRDRRLAARLGGAGPGPIAGGSPGMAGRMLCGEQAARCCVWE